MEYSTSIPTMESNDARACDGIAGRSNSVVDTTAKRRMVASAEIKPVKGAHAALDYRSRGGVL